MAEEKDADESRRKSERDLSEHDRAVARSAAHASRDVLHDASAGSEPGAYTTHEARDRAAHTPSILDRDGPQDKAEEEKMLAALHKEAFPQEKDWQAYQDKTGADLKAPGDAQQRRQYDDFKQMGAEEKAKESKSDVTPEEQEKVNKAMADTKLSKEIGGASDVNANPVPNDPTPIEKAKDIGQDLQKQGVTPEK